MRKRLVPAVVAALVSASCGLPALSGAPHPGRFRLAHKETPGPLFLVGSQPERPDLAAAFAALAAGPIVVVSLAGSRYDGERMQTALEKAGAVGVTQLTGDADKRDAERARVGAAAGLFFTGGDPLPLLSGFTPFLSAARQAWQSGCVVGGSSAGAMAWGERLIRRGESDDALREGVAGLEIRAGFGFLPGTILDPHFTERGRFYRLYLAARETGLTGIGVDPGAAALVHADRRVEAVGGGGVTLVAPDAAGARVSVLAPGQAGGLPDP